MKQWMKKIGEKRSKASRPDSTKPILSTASESMRMREDEETKPISTKAIVEGD
jgi:Asp-tRNA(Asn)/Glu-tRNA(Gln) amidotransferase C subunit